MTRKYDVKCVVLGVQLIRNFRSLITDKASGFCSSKQTIFQSDVITEKSSLAGSIKFPLILPPSPFSLCLGPGTVKDMANLQ